MQVRITAHAVVSDYGDDIARLQINRRLLAEAHTSRRAGEDHIAWLQTHETADVGYEFADGEDHIARRAALLRRAVDAERKAFPLGVAELVRRHHDGTHRTKAVEAFPLEPLTVAELQIFYLQKDASAWIKSSTEYLDVADQESKKILEERRKSDETAATATNTNNSS